MKYTLLLHSLFMFFSCDLTSRNPFCFGHPIPTLIAIGTLEPDKRHFTLIQLDKECYRLYSGDVIEGYKVLSIDKKQVTLKNTKNKKALQLKIAEGLGG